MHFVQDIVISESLPPRVEARYEMTGNFKKLVTRSFHMKIFRKYVFITLKKKNSTKYVSNFLAHPDRSMIFGIFVNSLPFFKECVLHGQY